MTDKSDRIKRLLDDDLVQEAFENTRNKYRRILESDVDASGQPITDDDVLEARRMLFLLRLVEQDLKQSVEDGEYEDFQANEKEQRTFLGELWNRKH